jgi:hypothetical protein
MMALNREWRLIAGSRASKTLGRSEKQPQYQTMTDTQAQYHSTAMDGQMGYPLQQQLLVSNCQLWVPEIRRHARLRDC